MAILEIRDVTSGYGEVQILWGASMKLDEGKLTCLVGGNGAGKTTMLRSVMGLLKPWSGSIWFQGQDVSRMPAYTKAVLGLKIVPEGRQLFTDMSVYENLEMGASNKRARPKVKQNLEKVYTMFPRLLERHTQKAGTLSGGEQQMLTVARTLMGNPYLVLLDEPSEGVAPVIVEQMAHMILALKEQGVSILLSEQNMHFAELVSDRAYVLEKGQIRYQASMRELSQNEEVRRAYLSV